MRKPVIAGNWKMYKLLGEAVETAQALKGLVANANHCEVVIAPVFTALKTVADRLEGSNVRLAAQNCAVQNEFGAHTGAIAPAMLKTPRSLAALALSGSTSAASARSTATYTPNPRPPMAMPTR